MLKNVQIIELISQVSFVLVEWSLTNPLESFWLKAEQFLHNIRQWLKKVFQKIFSLVFLIFPRMRFWETCWKTPAREHQKVSAQCPKLTQKIFFSNKKDIFLKVILWALRMQFLQPHWFFPTKNRKLFAQCPKVFKILVFEKSNFFSWKCSHGHVECIFENPTEKILPEGPNFFAQDMNVMKKTLIKLFFSNFFYVHVDCNFDKPAENIFPEDWTYFDQCPKILKIVQKLWNKLSHRLLLYP